MSKYEAMKRPKDVAIIPMEHGYYTMVTLIYFSRSVIGIALLTTLYSLVLIRVSYIRMEKVFYYYKES